MAVLTYKCPHCGGSLVFHPEKQNYACEYCLSEFTQEELDALNQEQEVRESEAVPHESGQKDTEEDALLYTCPSCGAEIATDQTTAATFCYYCHNPVILSGKLSRERMPSLVLPFQITKEEAKKRFLSWIAGKKYLPPDFFSRKQIEKLSGVYFPYWVCDCTMEGNLNGTARDIRVWRTGDTEYTETKVYSIRRAGSIELRDVARNALEKSQGKMMEGILPFDLKETKEFHTGFLSGFQAEMRDIEQETFEAGVLEETEGYAKNLLCDTVTSHVSFTADSFYTDKRKNRWNYVFLPVWILTYRSGGEVYYFAMNAQNGKVCGKLPVNTGKLLVSSTLIFAAVTALITLIGGIIL